MLTISSKEKASTYIVGGLLLAYFGSRITIPILAIIVSVGGLGCVIVGLIMLIKKGVDARRNKKIHTP